MKSVISAVVLSLAIATSAFAHCGKCGMEGEHKQEAGAAHSGVQCPMHGEKNAVLTEAAAALEGSNPELAAKLKDFAAKCCGGH